MINYTKLSNKDKAAILLVALGQEKSAKIFKNLSEDNIEELTLGIADLGQIDSQTKLKVLNEFYEICKDQNISIEGGISFAKEVLEEAIGKEKALETINKLTDGLKVKPFEFINKIDSDQLLTFIKNEHPQTVALVLSYLPPKKSAKVLSSLHEDKQTDITERIATMGSTSPEVIKRVETILETKLKSMSTQDYTTNGGIDYIVETLKSVDRGTEKQIMGTLEINNPELAQEISKRMFVFEDISNLSNKAIQLIVRESDIDDLAVALKGIVGTLRDNILSNMSSRLSKMLEEEIEFMGPIKISDQGEAQQKIVNIARNLEKADKITLNMGSDDEYIE